MDEPTAIQPLSATSDRLLVGIERGVTRIGFVRSDVDGTTIRELYETAIQLTNSRGAKLIVDLGGVRFASSSFMGMLVTIHKRLRSAGGLLCVIIPAPHLRDQFGVMKLDQLLSITPSVDERLLLLR